MKYQSARCRCGPNAVVNAIRCYGVKRRESDVAKHAGTTHAYGTQEHGIKQALERCGFRYSEILERKYERAEQRLIDHLRSGWATILLIEHGEHWVTAIGILGEHVVIFDGWPGAANRAEQGIWHYRRGTPLRRLWTPCAGVRYAIAVRPDAD